MTEKEYKNKVNNYKKTFDRILDTYVDRDFTELIGKKGGDIITLRIYKNGSVCER